jgi:hypothetical protein
MRSSRERTHLQPIQRSAEATKSCYESYWNIAMETAAKSLTLRAYEVLMTYSCGSPPRAAGTAGSLSEMCFGLKTTNSSPVSRAS